MDTRASNLADLVVIQATPFCNIHCRYCYLPDRSSTKRIKPKTIEKIFERLLDENLVAPEATVLWHAGEPTVLPQAFYESAFALIESVNRGQKHLTHNFQTNATLIDDSWCQFIKHHKMEIGVSIDGPKLIHDRNRTTRGGKGTFEQTMRGLRCLQKYEIPFSVITVVTEDTLDYAEELFQFYVSNNILRFGLNVEEREGENTNSTMSDDKMARYKAFFRKIVELQDAHHRSIAVREIESLANSILFAKGDLERSLNTPFRILSFDVDGNFSTYCPEMLTTSDATYGDFIFGNVHRDAISAMWDDPKFVRITDEIRVGIENCRTSCEYFHLCGGGNPVNKVCETGSFAGTETAFCRYQVKANADVLLDYLESKLVPGIAT